MTIQLTIGADPEVFAQNSEGKFISVHDRLPGTKAQPHKVNNGAIQVDGTAAEFNIDPADSEDRFVTNIDSVMQQLAAMLGNDLTLTNCPVAEYGREYMNTLPASALELGCDPDYNSYTGRENPRPDADVDFRTGAGHIHFGWGSGFDVSSEEHMEACCMLTKQLDAVLGLSSLMFDSNDKRRSLYGKAGAFRPKSYGMEYRVLSNAWVGNEKLTRWIYRQAVNAFNDLMNGRARYEGWETHIRQTINDSDRNTAKTLMGILHIPTYDK